MNVSHDIILKCQKGDSRAQHSLFDQYKKRWMGICVRYVKDVDDAKDVFQEAAVIIFKELKRLRQVEAFDGWARRIVVNQALNCLKKKKTHSMMLQDYGDYHQGSTQIDFDVLGRMENADVLDLIDKLPDGYGVVLNLALIDGYSHADISKMLTITESTSRSQLTKARKFLQNLIDERKRNENARIARIAG